MANLPRGLLTGSDPGQKTGPYGPTLSVTVIDESVDLHSADGTRIIAHYHHRPGRVAGYSVDPGRLDSSTVPYVNAFVRDAGAIDKYWRTGQYRFRPAAGWDIGVAAGIWAIAPSGSLAPLKVTQPVTVPATAPVAPTAPVSTARARAQGTAPAKQPLALPVQPVAPVTLTLTDEAGTVSAPVVKPALPPVSPIVRRKRTSTLRLPAGYVAVPGRNGELALPVRTLQTFEAAVHARFDEGLPAHVLVIGPSGTGKTESVLALAAKHGLEVAGIVQCGGIEGPADLYGQTVPDESAPHGWRRLPSALWQALAVARDNPERRYFVLLDEVNRMGTLAAQNSLLGMLDGTEALANPTTGEAIPLPPNLMVAATANIGVAYSGTVRMDAALTSRWWTNLVFTYLPEPVEVAIAKGILGATGDAVQQCRQLARAAAELRKAHVTDEFRSALIPGTREIVAVAWQSKYDPEGVAGAWHDKVVSSFSNEGRDPSRTEFARARVTAELVFKGAPIDDRDEDSES